MPTTKLFLGILCFAIVHSNGMFKRYLLKERASRLNPKKEHNLQARMGLVKRARRELGVRELTGNNDGMRVKLFLKCVGINIPAPWCAAYISFVFAQEGYPLPHSAWSPDLFPVSRLARSALPGDVLGIYFPELHRIAHVGIVEKMDGDWCLSIEGNTNVAGSRTGGGVYRKRRHVRTISKYADWISLGKVVP